MNVLDLGVQHLAAVREPGDGRFSPPVWRVHCFVCRTWWVGTDNEAAAQAVSARHTKTGEWL